MTSLSLFPALRTTRRRRLVLDPAAAHERYASAPERLFLGAMR